MRRIQDRAILLVWLTFVVLCTKQASFAGAPVAAFAIDPEVCPVDTPVEVCIRMRLDDPLRPGDSVALAPPESWSSQPYCITFTKEPQVGDPEAQDYIDVRAKGCRFDLAIEPVLLPSGGKKGHVRKVVATVQSGTVSAGQDITLALHNFRSTWLAESAVFRVWVNGQEVAYSPTIRTLPATAQRVRVIVPSSARPGEPFLVNVVSVDRFWNLSSSTIRNGTLRLVDGSVLEEEVSFAGSYQTKVSIPKTGIHRLLFNDIRSNPIRITGEPKGPFWGDLHAHDKTHNCGAGEHPYDYAQNVSCLDFIALVPDYRGLSPVTWPAHQERANQVNQPGHFSAFVGYEAGMSDGHFNVIFRGASGHIFDTTDISMRNADRIVTGLDPQHTMVIPHHVGVHWRPFEKYQPRFDPWTSLIEIYSSHGLAERYMPEHILSYEFNRVRGENKYASSVNRPVYVRDAWAQGRRFGVTASSDDHMGQPGKPIKGLTAVFAPHSTREDIWNSLKQRSCYATTGERLLLDFRINGHAMGSEVSAARESHLLVHVEVHGVDQLAFVEVVRYVFKTGVWERTFFTAFEDRDAFHEGDGIPLLDFDTSFEERFSSDAVYYLRVAQRTMIDGWPAFGWTSPIWVTASK